MQGGDDTDIRLHGAQGLPQQRVPEQTRQLGALADEVERERYGSAGPSGSAAQGAADATEPESAAREHEPSESGEGPSQKPGAPKRSAELLIKNRKAQQRFRERQKSKITELEEKNQELAADFKRLQQDNQNLDSRMTALVRLVHQKNAQIDAMRSGQEVGALDVDAAAAFTDDIVLSWGEGQTFALTPEQVRGLSREDLTKIWKEYVQQLASFLGGIDSSRPNAHPAAVENVERLTHELTMILLRVSISSPLVAKSFAATRMEEPHIAEDDPESVWRSIVPTLMLSGEQRSELIQLRQLFLEKLNAITDQRGEGASALFDATQPSPSIVGERASAVQYLKYHDAVTQLRQSLREEHALRLDFVSTVYKHLISPLQLARCLVQSYPWFPDVLALTTWLAADAGDPAAVAFFRAPGLPTLPLPGLTAPSFLLSTSRGSGYSTPRNATPPTPPRTTASPTPFQIGQPLSPGGGSWGLGAPQLLTQHSGHSGVSGMQQLGMASIGSPLYTPHSPSPGPSPPLSPSHALMPGMPKPQPPPPG